MTEATKWVESLDFDPKLATHPNVRHYDVQRFIFTTPMGIDVVFEDYIPRRLCDDMFTRSYAWSAVPLDFEFGGKYKNFKVCKNFNIDESDTGVPGIKTKDMTSLVEVFEFVKNNAHILEPINS